MKKVIFMAALIFGCLSIKNADAQISVSLGLNIGSQPDWGPVGYDHAEYYYMPDIDTYYDVNSHQYVYLSNNVWIHRPYLPARYRNYDRYHSYKVVVNERNPWERNKYYRSKYAGYKGRKGQPVIRDSHEAKYQDHWHDNGRHLGQKKHGDHGKGHGHGH
ncbi:MAG TPA: hypothetical protein VHA56_05405 [Mucilaginibacter sp.]|nr:hypothetical protein [Mucilaginibacter sp.]